MKASQIIEEMIQREPFEQRRLQILSLQSRIMAEMLNGTIDWTLGNQLRIFIQDLTKI